VITVSGSSARMANGCKDKPVDCVIVGIVDEVSLDERK
jgi:microcompartment protein CcmK/EutM